MSPATQAGSGTPPDGGPVDWKRAGLAQALGAADEHLDVLRRQAGADDATAFRMAAVGSAADDWDSGTLRRRGRRALGVDDTASLHLVSNDDGFLEWDFGPASGSRSAADAITRGQVTYRKSSTTSGTSVRGALWAGRRPIQVTTPGRGKRWIRSP